MTETKSLNISKRLNNHNTRGDREQSLHPNNTRFLEKLMIFIDGSNLFQGAKKHDLKLDFKKLINLLVKNYNLVRVYYYTGIPIKKTSFETGESEKDFEEKFNKQKKFLDSLAFDLNFDIVTKPLALKDGKIIEKGIDVRIASDIIWHGLSDNYDAFVFISGDKDLMDCLIRMKDNGKRVIVANFEDRISREMKKISDRYINLSQYLNEIKRD